MLVQFLMCNNDTTFTWQNAFVLMKHSERLRGEILGYMLLISKLFSNNSKYKIIKIIIIKSKSSKIVINS